MKNLAGFLIPILIIMGAAWMGKPSDQQCVDQVTIHYAGQGIGGVLSGTRVDRFMYHVEDNGLWKTVYFGGQRVAIGAFWNVFC